MQVNVCNGLHVGRRFHFFQVHLKPVRNELVKPVTNWFWTGMIMQQKIGPCPEFQA